LSELGSIILAYPLLKQTRVNYPAAELFFFTFKRNKDIFALLEGVIPDKNILTIRESPLFLFALDTLKALKKLRQESIDIVFDLEFFSRFSAIFAYLTGAHQKIGFYCYTFEGLYRGNFHTHKIQYNPLNHMSKTYLSLSQATKGERKDTPELERGIEDEQISFPKYVPKEQVKEKVEKKLKDLGINTGGRLFLLNPGEGVLPLREWPMENFIALSRRLLEDVNNQLIIVGTEGAAKKGEFLLRFVENSRCVNLTGQTSLEELMELFYIADALISNDCGLAHLAMLTSIKKFIIFGPEGPQVFGPLGDNNYLIYSGLPCSPCLSVLNHRNSACRDNVCLKVIRPEDVYALVQNSLK
jgi:ADP-heptose:LPS heptosyltransferase